jgi:hypothetical protein
LRSWTGTRGSIVIAALLAAAALPCQLAGAASLPVAARQHLIQQFPEGDGTLVDHSLILYGSNMGNSNQPLHSDTPAVLVGGASGRLKGDRYLPYASCTVPHRQFAAEHPGYV